MNDSNQAGQASKYPVTLSTEGKSFSVTATASTNIVAKLQFDNENLRYLADCVWDGMQWV